MLIDPENICSSIALYPHYILLPGYPWRQGRQQWVTRWGLHLEYQWPSDEGLKTFASSAAYQEVQDFTAAPMVSNILSC